MTFAHPTVLLALWLLPVLLLLRVWGRAKSGLAAQLFVAPRLRQELVSRGSPVFSWLIFGLQLLALLGLIIAIAGPRYGEEKIQVKEQGRSILIAIDTSRSMNALDVKPSRLERAKLAAEDLMLSLVGERVGLIAVAGRAYMQAPLTTDHEALVESVQALDSYSVPVGGSKLSEGIKEALEMSSKTAAREHCLLFFSDGGEKDPDLEDALRKAREKNVRIITFGIGTKEGSLIPNLESGLANQYIIDPETQRAVHTTLNEALLQQMAATTNGKYFNLGENMISKNFITQVLSTMDSIETDGKEITQPIERFIWPLSIGTLALMMSLFLRTNLLHGPSFTSVVLLMLSLAQPAVAKTDYSLESARKAYDQHDYTHAVEIYSYLLDHEASHIEILNYGLGSALFKLGKQDRAAEALSQALHSNDPELQKKSHHALGNSLYEAGSRVLQSQPEYTYQAWMDALSHYEAALKVRDDSEIQANRKELLKRIELLDQKKQEQQNNQSNQDSQKKESGEEKKENQKGKPKPEPGKDSQKGKDGESGEQEQNSEKGDKPSEQEGKQDSEKDDPDAKESDQPTNGDNSAEGKGERGDQGEQTQEGGLPEGNIQVAEQEDPSSSERPTADLRDEKTRFGKNEARNLLRMYSEQMMQKQLKNEQALRKRTRPAGSKDW